MPYIKPEEKTDITNGDIRPTDPGQLNYAVTKLINQYVQDKPFSKLSYQTINDIIGALEGAKMEFYRRIAVPYENEKLAINGDVYGSQKV